MMKHIVIPAILAGLLSGTGCGLQHQIDDLKDRTDHNEDSIDDVARRVKNLENDMASNKLSLLYLQNALDEQGNNVSRQIDNIMTTLLQLSNNDNNLEETLNNLSTKLVDTMYDVSILQGQVNNNYSILSLSLNNLSQTLINLQADIVTVKETNNIQDNNIFNIESQYASLYSNMNVIHNNIVSLQTQINSALVQLAVLQGYKNIVDIKDPCGTQGLYNEVFLRLSDGRYIASFSDNANGKNTRFTVLTNGNFVTTDGTNCYFTVSNNSISNEHN